MSCQGHTAEAWKAKKVNNLWAPSFFGARLSQKCIEGTRIDWCAFLKCSKYFHFYSVSDSRGAAVVSFSFSRILRFQISSFLSLPKAFVILSRRESRAEPSIELCFLIELTEATRRFRLFLYRAHLAGLTLNTRRRQKRAAPGKVSPFTVKGRWRRADRTKKISSKVVNG